MITVRTHSFQSCYVAIVSIFISHTSALEYLRADRSSRSLPSSRAKLSAGSIPTRSLVDSLNLAAFGITEAPVHLCVDNAESRSCSKAITCHVWRNPPSANSFVRIDDELYASAPDACLLQLAAILPPVKLMQVGYEFCGAYTLDPTEPHGFRERKPLTSVRSFERYLAKAEGIHGVQKARNALRFIADGSASPMETIVTLLLCLPSSYGGYGLEMPRLNQSVNMPDEVRTATGRKQCICDLFWPKAKAAVEYESDLWHTGSGRIVSDSKRRTALELAGISVATVTSGQAYDARALDETAHILAKYTGKRLRIQQRGWLTRRYNLRSQLLRTSNSPTEHVR